VCVTVNEIDVLVKTALRTQEIAFLNFRKYKRIPFPYQFLKGARLAKSKIGPGIPYQTLD
jgi:hypothetical protein